jgi:NhaP-type Na+/H+ or K+/H+ antiporter
MAMSERLAGRRRSVIELSISAIVITVFSLYGLAIRKGENVWTFEWGGALGLAVTLLAVRLVWWLVVWLDQ